MQGIDPSVLVMTMVAVVLGVTFHEFSHAWVALRLGDTTAAELGRVSLNPVVHFDPLGAMMMVLLMMGYAPIAWGKPVPINPARIWGGRRGFALSSLAGPLSNLLLAAIASTPYQLGIAWQLEPQALDFIDTVITINLSLAAFNMVPLPPLDGFNTLAGFVPQGWAVPLERLRQPAMGVFMALLLIPWLLNRMPGLPAGISPLQGMVGPVYILFYKLLMPAGACCRMVSDGCAAER